MRTHVNKRTALTIQAFQRQSSLFVLVWADKTRQSLFLQAAHRRVSCSDSQNARQKKKRKRKKERYKISDYKLGSGCQLGSSADWFKPCLRWGTKYQLLTGLGLVSMLQGHPTNKSLALLVSFLHDLLKLRCAMTFGRSHINKRLLLVLYLTCFYLKFTQAAASAQSKYSEQELDT